MIVAIIVVLVVVIGAGAFVLLGDSDEGNNVTEEGATFTNFGEGTTFCYKGSGTESGTSVDIEMDLEWAAYTTDGALLKHTTKSLISSDLGSISNSSVYYTTSEDVADMSEFTFKGTETIDTCDGKQTVDKYVDDEGEYYFGQMDSGKKNGVLYKMEDKDSSLELKNYKLCKAESYTPTKIGDLYGSYKSGDEYSTKYAYVIGEVGSDLIYGLSYDSKFDIDDTEEWFILNGDKFVDYDNTVSPTTKNINGVDTAVTGYSYEYYVLQGLGSGFDGCNAFIYYQDSNGKIVLIEEVNYENDFSKRTLVESYVISA